jgi:hypothetical protein
MKPAYSVGIVGHRFLGKRETEDFVIQRCRSILSATRLEYPDLVAVSAIAEGADTHFAQVAISLGIPLQVVRPFWAYSVDFVADAARQKYLDFLAGAFHEEILPFAERSEDAYFATMHWVVCRSDLLIAAWDGNQGRGKGGTADAVRQVRELQRPWIHLDVTNHSQYSYGIHGKGIQMA